MTNSLLEEMRGDWEHGGNGSFRLHPHLVVLRAWWIDECDLYSSNEIDPKTNEAYLNDMITVYMNDIFINETISFINAPVLLPIYDHSIVSKIIK